MTYRLTDGFPTIMSFSANPSVYFYQKTVTPPGMDGGGTNDVTTMLNTAFRTFMPKKLKSMAQASATSAYDPAVYSQINAMINVNQQITVTFPDASSVTFWGYIDKFTPNEVKEGEQPTAQVVIEPTNLDNSQNEQAPVYTPAA